MTAIRELIEAVERGEFPHCEDEALRVLFPYPEPDECDFGLTAAAAFDGSVDAAISLKEAVLPGHKLFDLHEFDDGDWSAEIERLSDGTGFTGCVNGNPGRALLLAILRAMEAQQ